MKKKNIKWKYSFLKENLLVSVSVTLMLILCFYLSSFWIPNKVVFLFSVFVIIYFKEVYFPFNYDLSEKDKKITVSGVFQKKEIDLTRFYRIKKWKNGLFLSTMVKDTVRGIRLFIKKEDISEIREILDRIINENK
ncbi:MAG: hypothetical protein M0R46_03885 [Candidatus Muirbacterium halophilum]|nr:hypothetical protein [Candidatus Muirbacterium halophilum]MCK9475032.1 hypothetical protein [Candidatus Muirbacterium halophilum]